MTKNVFIATSLDGFIARPDGSLDWLLGATDSTDDHGYNDFISGIDTIVMGRGTFDAVVGFESWPFDGLRVIVASSSRTQQDYPHISPDKYEIIGGDVSTIIRHCGESGAKNIYVDGGALIQSFLREGMVDTLTITRIPVLIGEGIPLFGSLPKDVRCTHQRTRSYDSGFVQSTYQVILGDQ